MREAKIRKFIAYCNELVEEFSEQTQSFPVDFVEYKECAIWSINYNVIKLEFLLTKKEKLFSPVSTLFCRIYFGKNDTISYHIPEFIEYLDANDFKCYYFPYIESVTRLESCFEQLALFLKKHLKEINKIALDADMCSLMAEKKMEEIHRLFLQDDPQWKEKLSDEKWLEFFLDAHEDAILLSRFTRQDAYQEFLQGNYAKSIKQYEKIVEKKEQIFYEERLLKFIKTLRTPYEAIPKSCASVLEIKDFNGGKKDGLAMLQAILVCEVIFGTIGCILVVLMNAFLARDTLYFCGAPWYCGMLVGGLPAIFGGIALRRSIAERMQIKQYQKLEMYDDILNTKRTNWFANVTFGISIVVSMILLITITVCTTSFYEDRLVYNAGEKMLSMNWETCYYSDLEQVIYSQGVYNDYDEYIERPSYLLCFSDGTVWDSDGFTTVETVEEKILSILESYYEEIQEVKARNEWIKNN